MRNLKVPSCMVLLMMAPNLGVDATQKRESRNWKLQTENRQPCSSVILIPPRRDHAQSPGLTIKQPFTAGGANAPTVLVGVYATHGRYNVRMSKLN